MGCDGGTIPKRSEVVKVKQKEQKVDEATNERIRWEVCALSQQPLRDPVAADELGHVLNREAVLEALVNKSMPKKFKHIRSLKVRHSLCTIFLCRSLSCPSSCAVPHSLFFPFFAYRILFLSSWRRIQTIQMVKRAIAMRHTSRPSSVLCRAWRPMDVIALLVFESAVTFCQKKL